MTDPVPSPVPAAPTPIVSARNMRKSFAGRQILFGLDFDIPPGRIFGLVGHNGAGKTTTLNALLGLIPCEGEIRVLGRDPYAHRAALMREVAFISDVASLPRFLKVRETLDLVAGIHPGFRRERAEKFLEGTEVKPGALVGNLSKGMIAQLHLAIVMAIEARLLVLDEPTLGLDITYRKRFYRRLLEDYMTSERTLLITTHQVDEIEFMLTDILFMRDGRLVLNRPMDEVGARFAQLIAVEPEKAGAARALGPVYEETRFGQTVMVFEGADRAALAALGTVSSPSLSDLFVALMEKKKTEPGKGEPK
jgi:ABC-2 type transport system ATP-binding protein